MKEEIKSGKVKCGEEDDEGKKIEQKDIMKCRRERRAGKLRVKDKEEKKRKEVKA